MSGTAKLGRASAIHGSVLVSPLWSWSDQDRTSASPAARAGVDRWSNRPRTLASIPRCSAFTAPRAAFFWAANGRHVADHVRKSYVCRCSACALEPSAADDTAAAPPASASVRTHVCVESVWSAVFPPRAQNYWVVVHGRRSLTQNIGCFRQRALSLIFRGFGPYDGHVSAGECALRLHSGNSQHSW